MNEKYTLKAYELNKNIENIRILHPGSTLNDKTLWVGTPDEIKQALNNRYSDDMLLFACSGNNEELKRRSSMERFSVRFYKEDVYTLYEQLVTRRLTVNKWAYLLKDAALLNYSVKDIITTCATTIINGMAFIIDSDFKVSYMGGSTCLESDLAKDLINNGSISSHSIKRIISHTPHGSILVRRMENGNYCWASKIQIENVGNFYVFLFTENDTLKNDLPALFGMLIENFRIVYLHRKHEEIPFGDFKALINSILDEKLTSWEEINAYMKRLPNPPHRYITIGVVEANPSVQIIPVDTFMSKLKTVFPGCSSAQIGDIIVLLISADTKVNQPRPIFNEEALINILTDNDAYIAFSNATQRLEIFKTEYNLALTTLRLGLAIKEYGNSRIYYFEDYAEYVYIDLLMDRFKNTYIHNDMLFLTTPPAVEVYRYDQINGTDLQVVLYNYCKYNGNISIAAAKSFMHRNTFAAKFSQIKEILKNTDLSDRRIRERMLFSCRVFRYYTYYFDKYYRIIPERLPNLDK